MEVQLLGTAAAAGWPNPWCRCASCAWMRDNGDVRGQTSALVDGRLLVDCGPEAPRAGERLGRSLADVRYLLFTHAHPDHTGAAALMWRGWVDTEEPLDVAGPPAVLDECRRWVDPTAPIRWHELHVGDVIELGPYRVTALAAAHGGPAIGPALLYDITGADGARLLWATDTAALPEQTLDAVTGAAYDAVFLEQTNGDDLDTGTDHLDLQSWPQQIAELRRRNAVTATTQLVPIHLGHGNPPPPQLRARMSAWGARVPDEGEIVVVGARTEARPPAPRRILVTGGARSGKSRWAESLVADQPDVLYVATARPRPDDVEWQERLDAHRRRRPSTWRTVETQDVAKAIAEEPVVLLECATLWLAAAMDEPDVDAHVDELVEALSHHRGTVVIVTNEVGSGVVPPTESGRHFRDALGALNARLARTCDEVWLVTAGVPWRLA